MGLALLAALGTVLIAVLGAIASYIDNYYTESVGQWAAHDLRIRVYDHLHRLSLTFYDNQRTGPLLSTITSDVATVQDFASSADSAPFPTPTRSLCSRMALSPNRGTHDELLKMNGIYAELHRVQFSAPAVAAPVSP